MRIKADSQLSFPTINSYPPIPSILKQDSRISGTETRFREDHKVLRPKIFQDLKNIRLVPMD